MRNIKPLITLIVLCISRFTGLSQTSIPKEDSLILYTFECNDSLSLKIPSGTFKVSRFNYEEGFILTIEYSDHSRISILCGSNASLRESGSNDKNLYFRKEVVKGHEIIYQGVPKNRLNLFNTSFDLLEKK